MSDAAESRPAAAAHNSKRDAAAAIVGNENGPSLAEEDNAWSLGKLLESAREMEEEEIKTVYCLVDELTSNCNKRIVVTSFTVKQSSMDTTYWELEFDFCSLPAYLMWRTCVSTAIFNLQLNNNIHCERCSTERQKLKICYQRADLNILLEFLNPLARKSYFDEVKIGEFVGTADLYAQTLTGALVKIIEIDPFVFKLTKRKETEDFSPWLDLIEKLSPSSIIFHRIQLTKALTDFIIASASIVSAMYISARSIDRADAVTLPFLKNILSRNCRYLQVNDVVTNFSLVEVKEMVQFFQENRIQCSLAIPTNYNISTKRIGDYRIKQEVFVKKTREIDLLLIEPFKIDPKTREKQRTSLETLSYKIATIEMQMSESTCIQPPPAKRRAIDLKSSMNEDSSNVQMLRDIVNAAKEDHGNVTDQMFDVNRDLIRNKSKKILVTSFFARSETFQKCQTELIFYFHSSMQQYLWHTCLITALFKAGIKDHSISLHNHHDRLREICSLTWKPSNMSPEDLKKMHAHVKPLTEKTNVLSMFIDDNRQELMNVCTRIWQNSAVNTIFIRPWVFISSDREEIEDFDPWIELIRRIRPRALDYSRVQLTNGLMIFLTQAADVVKRMMIGAVPRTISKGLPAYFVQELLSRKCRDVQVSDPVTKLSRDAIQNLVQFFHHTGQKVVLTIPRADPTLNAQIGEFRMDAFLDGAFRNNTSLLNYLKRLKHLLINRQLAQEYEDPDNTVPTTSVPGFITTSVSGITRVCSCEEAAACRKRSLDEINWCMRTCDNYLQEYGNQTESYLECFSKNPASVIEAENCLFKEMGEHCTHPHETLFMEWKKPAEVKYSSDPHHTIKRDLLWKRPEKKYNHIQKFLHCTKHCVHKQLHKCTSTKGCVIRLLKHEVVTAKMRDCAKKNVKIAQSLLSTCHCLAWQRNVTQLRGSCVVIGNQYYVDRA